MPQLVRIAHYIQRPNDVALELERRGLHRSIRCVHNDTGQAVDGRKTHREVVSPPLTWVLARDPYQEPRYAIGAVDHLQRRSDLATAVRHDANIAREQLRQCIEVTRLGCRCEGGQELRMFRVNLTRAPRRRGRATWSRVAHVRTCAGGKLAARRFVPLQCRGYFIEREIEHVVQQEGGSLER